MLFPLNGRRPDPNVARVVAARFISHTGGVAGFFLGIWGKAAYDLDADAFGLALVMAVTGLAGLVGAMAAGVLVDRADPKRVLVAGELVFVPAVLSLVLADSIPMMALLVLPATLAGSMVFTAVTTLPPFLTEDPRRLERLNAYIEGAGTAAFIAGPVIGAFIVNAVFGAGLLAGSLLYGRFSDRLTSLRVAATVTVASGAGAVLYTGTASLTVVIGGAVAWGTILGVLMPLVRTLGQLEAPVAMVGRVMGTLQVHHQAGDLVPLLFAPALAGVFGVQAVLVGSGVAVALVAIASIPAASRMPTPVTATGLEPPHALEGPIGVSAP